MPEEVASFWIDENGKFRVRIYPAIAGVVVAVVVGVMRALGYL